MDESIPLVGCLVCGLARIHGFRGAQLFGTARKEERFKMRIYFTQSTLVNNWDLKIQSR